jgi:glycosyltransferase involved in cell wall biosynthesis
MQVTVLMAVYNGVDTVGPAVESVLAQTLVDFELLIVDDASTDDTPALLDSFRRQDSRVRIVRNAVNRGMAASLNVGIGESTGPLIARLDADDTCLPHRLEKQVAFLAAHPEVAVLGGGAELIDEAGDDLGPDLRPERHEELVRRIYRECPFYHPSVMVRREFYQTYGGYDERMKRSCDYDLWLKGYREYRYQNLPEPIIRYRVRNRPVAKDLYEVSLALMLAGRRELKPVRSGLAIGRYVASNLLSMTGLRKSWPRRAA